MKTIKNIILGIILAFALFSCDNPIALGSFLDLDGPEIAFTSPVPRKAVNANFILEGTAKDYSGVNMLLVKVEKDTEEGSKELPRQWRYSKKGGWEISDDSGINWRLLPDAAWKEEGSIVIWSITIDMVIDGILPEDGEYLFSAQAWDSGSVTDDKSFKTIVLIIDNDPPQVTVFNPVLYDRYLNYNPATDKFNNTELEDLRGRSDWRDPELIGKFQTSSFTMQWSIEDNFNLWSFDLRFYEMSVPVDNRPETPLSDDYIYRYHINLPPVPDIPSPGSYLKPNGSVTVPALDGPISNGENGELKKPITNKTTIRAVAVCYDAANNVSQEKTLGYLIFWPQADIPWITYSGDLKTPEDYDDKPGNFSDDVQDAFLVYPGRDIKAIAFHAQGVKEVTFSLYKIEEPKDTLQDSEITLLHDFTNIKKENPPRGDNNYSTSFSWDFRPPPRSAFYIVEAKVLSVSGKESEITKAIFKVQDISFPDFPNPIQPPALEPFFKYVDTVNDTITIHGIVSDATEIDSLCLVWINPQSKEYAAQKQLQYFRDANYDGWQLALEQAPGGSYKSEEIYDDGYPNKVWRLSPVLSTDYPNSINPDTQRIEYNFSITIPLEHLNIGIGKQPLKSQVFLIRASNPSPKTTVITYTPQGDETPPEIKITGVNINDSKELKPGQFGEIDKFKNGDTITINGAWKEDSVYYLDFEKYLKENFIISINQINIPQLTFTNTTLGNNEGTWQATATVKESGTFGINDIALANLKDTLVVAATVKDIGGNVSEDGSSWLIKSDTLRLVRISSELADQTYNAGKIIEIFIEFNKPVRLKNGGNPLIELNIPGGGTARYIDNQNNQNTRQYFVYTVQAGQSTTDQWLDVTGLAGIGTGNNYWEADTYPFIWESVSGAGTEQLRVTMNANHYEGNPLVIPSGNYLLRRLPVKPTTTVPGPSDIPYTLANGKNIGIDTAAPVVSNIYTSNKAGHYALGSEITVNVVFNEAVKITDDANPPQLILQVNNNRNDPSLTLVTTSGTPKVNNDTVTFTYTVQTNDTTGDARVIVNSFTGGQITDIAGTNMNSSLSSVNRTLNGGGLLNSGDGVFINTIAPGIPTFRALSANSNTAIISNTVSGSVVTGESGAAAKDIKNYYGNDLYFAINGNITGGTNRLGSLEYSLDGGSNWKRIDNPSANGAPFKQEIYGKYTVITRQIDKAGNISASSNSVSLNWDPGALVTRIDSSSPNGTYTNNSTRTDSINITVYFRKPLTITGTPQITLNAIRGTGTTNVTINDSAVSSASTLSFTYGVANNDNTPAGQNLDVTAFSITATDADGVNVNSFISLPADTTNRLISRKEIRVQTGALTIQSGPSYSTTQSGDEANVTITLTFNRAISKRDGNITVTQQTSGYRLPAVLTETQANRYKNARNFNTYYSRGTNGASNAGVPDTSAKLVMNYNETTVVTPNNSGSAQQQMAYDFLQEEIVTLPVSSQAVTISGNTLTITLDGSNALQVLGASYDVVIPAGLVQDDLGYQSPPSNSTFTTTGINRPFVRIDKKVNADRITTETGSASMPYLLSNYNNLITTTARLDCRTPNSTVRYAAAGAEHVATVVDSPGTGVTTNTGETYRWKNTANNADTNNLNSVVQQTVGASSGGTPYNDFSVLIPVGTAANNNIVQGYVWRIAVRSTNSTNTVHSNNQYDEIAFRTVLTYEVAMGANQTQGQVIGNGDQLWIRGGDAVGSSSVSGFPINWQDDYEKLSSDKKRAGIRLLRRESAGTNMYADSVWRWVTWEINVQTWHDVVLAHQDNAGTLGANDAWQYGPLQWAYQRAGWAAQKDQYTLIPGKHRWVRMNNASFDTGVTNFSLQFNSRGVQTLSFTQPNP